MSWGPWRLNQPPPEVCEPHEPGVWRLRFPTGRGHYDYYAAHDALIYLVRIGRYGPGIEAGPALSVVDLPGGAETSSPLRLEGGQGKAYSRYVRFVEQATHPFVLVGQAGPANPIRMLLLGGKQQGSGLRLELPVAKGRAGANLATARRALRGEVDCEWELQLFAQPLMSEYPHDPDRSWLEIGKAHMLHVRPESLPWQTEDPVLGRPVVRVLSRTPPDSTGPRGRAG